MNSIAFGLSLALIFGYHFYLRYRLRHDPSYTIQAINNLARETWVENIMIDREKQGVLAVQTLRNSTMATTFLASTAILLNIGVLNLMQKDDNLSRILNPMHAGSDAFINSLWVVKLLMLLMVFFWAFFCFSLAVRLYNHVGYLINSSNSNRQFCPSAAYVARLLNRSGQYYSLGMRAYYMSIPLVFWLFGPLYMLAASMGLVVILYHVDRAPLPTDMPANLPSAPAQPVDNAAIAIVPRKAAAGVE
ncbi:MAG: DUF599 domain-containing protein [Gammaproteobacteria bacterium]|nr:DUF599 domain-containing protein [Gammaproteobacteria bacterium]